MPVYGKDPNKFPTDLRQMSEKSLLLRNSYVLGRERHIDDAESFKGSYHLVRNSKGELISRYGVNFDDSGKAMPGAPAVAGTERGQNEIVGRAYAKMGVSDLVK